MSVSLFYFLASTLCVVSPVLSRGQDHLPPQLVTLLLMQPRILLAFFAARAHCWFTLKTRTLQVFFCKAAFHIGGPVLVHEVVQDFAVYLVELHEDPVSPFLHSVKVHLNGSTTLWCCWFSFHHKEGELHLCHHVTAHSRHVFNLYIQVCGRISVFTWSLTIAARIGAKVFPDTGFQDVILRDFTAPENLWISVGILPAVSLDAQIHINKYEQNEWPAYRPSVCLLYSG